HPENKPERIMRLERPEHLIRSGQLGETEPARQLLELMPKMYEEVDRRADQAASLRVLGELALQEGYSQKALELLHRGSSLAETVGDYELRLSLMTLLGRVEARFGDVDAASNLLDGALRMARQAGLRLAEADTLVGLGWTRLRRGEYEESARLAAIAGDQSDSMGY